MKRCSRPSRSTYWAAQKRTTAWPTVSRTVFTAPPLRNRLQRRYHRASRLVNIGRGAWRHDHRPYGSSDARWPDRSTCRRAGTRSDADLAARLDPALWAGPRTACRRATCVLRGLPFELGTRSGRAAGSSSAIGLTIALGRPVRRRGTGRRPDRATWSSPTSATAGGIRPASDPPECRSAGCCPTGEPLARYELGLRRRQQAGPRGAAAVRDRRRDHRLGLPAVRGRRPPVRRGPRLARPVPAPGSRAGTHRPGMPDP